MPIAGIDAAAVTYQCHLCVEGVFVFGSDNLVEVVCGRIPRWHRVVLIQHGNVGVAGPGEVQRRGQTKGAGANDENGRGVCHVERFRFGSTLVAPSSRLRDINDSLIIVYL